MTTLKYLLAFVLTNQSHLAPLDPPSVIDSQ